MNLAILENRTTSLNAKIAAVSLVAAAFMTLALSHTSMSLAPLRLIALSIGAFAVWSFCDEMGIKKPLNRAGFVLFSLALVAKAQITLGVSEQFVGRYLLLYSAFLLLSIQLWSAAFLHRKRTLKIVGAVGLVASLTPLLAILVGHLFVGAGAVFGVGALLSAAGGQELSDFGFVIVVERIFGVWAYIAAWLLWRGHIQA